MVDGQYNLVLVMVSYAISVLGSYTALNLAIRIPGSTGSALFGWLSMAAIAIGGGAIWSMHFIGMLAFNTKMAVSYDFGLTALSLVLAIVVCGVGLFIVSRGATNPLKLLAGGVITGFGVATMHYTGMAAMKMPVTISYDTTLFIASLVIAVVAAVAALWLAFNLRGSWQRFGSAFIMGIAVSGMHYTGMAAMKMTPTSDMVMHTVTTNNYPEAILIFVIAALTMGGLLIMAMNQEKERNDLAF